MLSCEPLYRYEKMPDIIQVCSLSNTKFPITEKDQAFYKKMNVPLPTLCPDERQRRRLSWRNEHNLYKRKCDATGKDIISIYSVDKPFKVYSTQAWYSDSWDATDYGREFDFSRTFTEQFGELLLEVPKINLITLGDNENSDYTNDNYRLKNCYLIFDAEQAKDCMYGESVARVTDSLDFYYLLDSSFCYEIVSSTGCQNLKFSRFCRDCSDSSFLLDCRGCRDCFACCNLRQKRYCIANKQYSKEEYEQIMSQYDFGSYQGLEKIKKYAEEFFASMPKRASRGLRNESCSGDNLIGCKDSEQCFDCIDIRDCKFCTNVLMGANDCYDVDIWGDGLNLAYDCQGVGAGAENIIGSYYVGASSSNVYHSYFCFKNCHNLLGCAGLIQKQYCILNKQYKQEEYQELLPKIIAHMRKTGEWGEMISPKLSTYGYNETVANDYFPLSKEEALDRGYLWKEPDLKEYLPQSFSLPDHIKETPQSVVDEILACLECKRNYKINETEFNFYKKESIRIPRKCFYCRHKARFKLRNPRQLHSRHCDKCQTPIQTTYSPSRPEKIYCESCYQDELV